jgi:hypothetical protein
VVLLLAAFAVTARLAANSGACAFAWANARSANAPAKRGSYRTLAAVRNANAMPVSAPVCITAVGTANARGPVDIRGIPHDYIEISNVSDRPFDLTGCTLTDRASKADKWKFPPTVLPPRGWLIVWASGQDRVASRHTVNPSTTERGTGWGAVYEDRSGAAYRVWQCISSVDTNATNTARASLRLRIPGEAPGRHSLWLHLRSVTSAPTRVVCTVQGRSIAIAVTTTNDYRFHRIVNPEREDGAWPLAANDHEVAIELAAGAVRVGRLVNTCAEEPFGNGMQDLHINFRINREGDFVGLFSPEGVPLDYVTSPCMQPGESYRRSPNRRSDFFVAPAYASIPHVATPPRIIQPSGPASRPTHLVMQTPDRRDVIRYTLDGSLPNQTSPAYEAPVALASNAVVRARAFRTGAAPSASTDRTYWFDNVAPLPVLSVVMEQGDLDDPEYGLFMTRHRRGAATERPCHLTLIEPEGRTVSARAGIRVQGRSTRIAWSKQNWRFTFREQYGDAVWPKALFEQDGPRTSASFVAVAGGHAPLQVVYAGAEAVGLRTPRTRMVAMYVNARPYGLYLLADDVNNPHYLEQAFGHLDISVFKEKTSKAIKWGPTNAFDEVWGPLLATPRYEMTTNMVDELIDLKMLTRFYTLVSYFGMGDCAQGYFIRDNRSVDRRWTMLMWDLEGAFFYPYEEFIFNMPGVVGKLFKSLSKSKPYMSEVYYPEYQAMLNHAMDQERSLALLAEYQTICDRYADEEWAAYRNQHDERVASLTHEAFIGGTHDYMTNAIRYARSRTDDMFELIRKKLGQDAIHPVTVSTAPRTPPLLADGYPLRSPYRGRYVNGTYIRIEPQTTTGAATLRFDVDGTSRTNTALLLKVVGPLTITVSPP